MKRVGFYSLIAGFDLTLVCLEVSRSWKLATNAGLCLVFILLTVDTIVHRKSEHP